MTHLPDRASLGARPIPGWYQDAKLGIFLHWGLYSVPAFADPAAGDFTSFMRDLTAMKDTRGNIPYAEWYLNALRVPGSPTARHHRATYGDDFPYTRFRDRFDTVAAETDLGDWARFFAGTGAQYVVMVTRHLDGYPLWPTKVPNPRMPADYRVRRDLVGDLTSAVRAQGLRMGLYYAGGIDWTFTDRPIRTMTDLMEHQALGEEYARYATAQWRELIDAYQPSILWNDMGWPAEQDPHELFAHYYDSVAEGVVNDRWTQVKMPRNRLARRLYLRFIATTLKLLARGGRQLPTPVPTFHYDVQTHEYSSPETALPHAWELTRGLGTSFGYNAQESAADMLTGTALVRLLVDVVSKGGNLLINVGPDGHGRIPEMQQQPLRELGAWLETNGQAIFATRPWTRTRTATPDGHPVHFTCKDTTVYATVLADGLPGTLVIRDLTLSPGTPVELLGADGRTELAWTQRGTDVEITAPQRRSPAHVLVMTPLPGPGLSRPAPE
ncbi:alpha-L-fucosidase [Streptosporangium album]|uniref:alpha-L-fucosidase n=1 Tax=Streptosporangium album TaxID=47479 RepID=A0A7W7RWJ1_9ACTN|nr:alpha-L-fucosidase [Streptosporangium album]MBB4939475.1 alpha-L-fucosidase [Streptosporangium album]